MWRQIPRRNASGHHGSPRQDAGANSRLFSEVRQDNTQHPTVPVSRSWLDTLSGSMVEISRRLATVENSLPRRTGTEGSTSDVQQYANSNNPTSTTMHCTVNLSEPFFTVTRAPSNSSAPSVYEEQCRLFGYQPRYQPSVSSVLGKRTTSQLGKGIKKKNKPAAARQLWRKEVALLRYINCTRVPDTKERMLMAKLGLGCKEMSFDLEGDEVHLHQCLLAEFPVLEKTGGYSLFRPNTNSYDLITIEAPQGGMTIRYLKDILRSARLYIRPLQCNVETDDDEEDDELELFTHDVKVKFSEVSLIKLFIIRN